MTLSKSARNVVLELLAISLLTLPFVAFGQDQITGGPQNVTDLFSIVQTVVNWIVVLFFVIAVVFIILAAFGYLTAGGDEEKVSSAKKKLIYAVVAIIVAALAFAIPTIIQTFLRVDVSAPPPDTGF